MGCLCATARWKREEVPDHKFDYIDINEFYQHDCLVKFGYSKVFILVFQAVLVYIADLMTAIVIGAWNQWSDISPEKASKLINFNQNIWNVVNQLRWVYVGCVGVSFLLLAVDMRKALKIIKSRDISFAFTSIIAYRYYTLRSYSHFCFFRQINNQRKISDRVALFVFFTLKCWKRLFLAEMPRQAINFLLIFARIKSLDDDARRNTNITSFNLPLFLQQFREQAAINPTPAFSLFVMTFVLTVWTINVILVLFALAMYLPLLCKIRGNLKEYCCHMIDKRIGELMRKKARKRLLRNQQSSPTNLNPSFKPELPVLDDFSGKTAVLLPSIQMEDEVTYHKDGYVNTAPTYYTPVLSPMPPQRSGYDTMATDSSRYSGRSNGSNGSAGGPNRSIQQRYAFPGNTMAGNNGFQSEGYSQWQGFNDTASIHSNNQTQSNPASTFRSPQIRPSPQQSPYYGPQRTWDDSLPVQPPTVGGYGDEFVRLRNSPMLGTPGGSNSAIMRPPSPTGTDYTAYTNQTYSRGSSPALGQGTPGRGGGNWRY